MLVASPDSLNQSSSARYKCTACAVLQYCINALLGDVCGRASAAVPSACVLVKQSIPTSTSIQEEHREGTLIDGCGDFAAPSEGEGNAAAGGEEDRTSFELPMPPGRELEVYASSNPRVWLEKVRPQLERCFLLSSVHCIVSCCCFQEFPCRTW